MSQEQRGPSFTDRLIARVAPRRALERYAARMRLDALTRFAGGGGYAGARSDRKALKNWSPRAGSADSDTIPDLETLRARSRDLERNAPIALGAINTNITSVIGPGLSLEAQIDRDFLGLEPEAAAAWERTAERIFRLVSAQIDITRRRNFRALTRLVWRSRLSSGDVLVLRRFKRNRGDLLGLKIQLIEADRLATPDEKSGDENIIDGVEFDGDGAPTRYWIREKHPGDWILTHGKRWTSVPAFGRASGERQMLHIARGERVGLTRGVPYLAPVIEILKQVTRYTDAELMAAVVSSFLTVFVKSDSTVGLANEAAAGTTAGSESELELELGAGTIVGPLLPGESIETVNPNRPNTAFDPFMLAVWRQIGAALEVPLELLIKHFTASYSAARAAMLEAWRYFSAERVACADEFCSPVYEWVITEAIASGLLSAPGYFDDPLIRQAWLGASWTGRPQGQINPKDEVTAAIKRLDAGLASKTGITRELSGEDWEAIPPQRGKEKALEQEHVVEPAAPALAMNDPQSDPDAPEDES